MQKVKQKWRVLHRPELVGVAVRGEYDPLQQPSHEPNDGWIRVYGALYGRPGNSRSGKGPITRGIGASATVCRSSGWAPTADLRESGGGTAYDA